MSWDKWIRTGEESLRRAQQSDVRQRSVNQRVLRSEDAIITYDSGEETVTPVGDRYYWQNAGSYEDLRFPATAINPPGLVGDPDWDTTNGGWLFDGGSTEMLFLLIQIPHAWEEGTTLHPHVHWQKSTSAAGTVLWQLEYKWAPIGAAMDATFTTISSSTPTVSDADTADWHALTDLGNITATGKQISDMILAKLSRLGGTDTYAADARLLEFDIHYQVNSFGSREEYTK